MVMKLTQFQLAKGQLFQMTEKVLSAFLKINRLKYGIIKQWKDFPAINWEFHTVIIPYRCHRLMMLLPLATMRQAEFCFTTL